MATRNYVPRADGEGNLGTLLKRWFKGWFQNLHISGEITNGNSGVSVTVADLDDAVNDAHTHPNKSELDLVTDGDHDIRTDNPHNVTPSQIEAGFTNQYEKIGIYAANWDISLAPAPAYAISALTDAGGLMFDPNITETARFSIVLPDDVDLTTDPILRLMMAPVVAEGAGGNQAQMQLTVRPVATGELLTQAIAETIGQTIIVPSAALELFAADLTLDGSLLGAMDHIGLALSRLGGDGNDTRLGDIALMSAWFIYKKAKLFPTE
jgi:hypothetical protein